MWKCGNGRSMRFDFTQIFDLVKKPAAIADRLFHGHFHRNKIMRNYENLFPELFRITRSFEYHFHLFIFSHFHIA